MKLVRTLRGFGFRRKLLISICLLFLVTIAIIELIVIFGFKPLNFKGILKESEIRTSWQLQSLADLNKDRLESFIDDHKEHLLFFANSPYITGDIKKAFLSGIDPAEAKAAKKRLEDSINARTKLMHLHGVVIADSLDEKIKISTDPKLEGKSVKDTGFFTKTRYYNSMYISDESFDGNDTCLYFNMPILLDAETNRQAVVSFYFEIADIGKIFGRAETVLGKTGEIILVNKKVQLLDKLQSPLTNLTLSTGDQISGQPAILAASGMDGMVESIDYKNEKVLAAFRYIRLSPDNGWGLVIKQNHSEIFDTVKAQIITFIFIGLAAITILSLLTLAATTYILSPINQIVGAARKITEGDMNTKFPINPDSELGILSKVFNDMLKKFRDWHKELEKEVSKRTSELEASKKELTEAKNSAENASKTKTEFLATMSHEIRTPLNGILGFSEILEHDLNSCEMKNKEPMKFSLNTIKHCGEILLSLLDDILELSRIESGKFQKAEEAFHPEKLINEVSESFLFRAKEKNVALITEFIHLPKLVIADKKRITQILFNLIGNAMKFTSIGSVKISAWMEKETLCIAINDTGVGIPSDKLNEIFTPFYQVDQTSTRKYGGAGLGLSIVKRLTEMLEGSVSVESQVGKGSTFTLKVPVKGLEKDKLIEPAQKVQDNSQPLKGIKILIVEDDPINGLYLSTALKSCGADTITAANYTMMTELCENKTFDIALLDIALPGQNGYECLKWLRAKDSVMKIFAQTANVFEEDRKKYKEAGFDGFIGKPFRKAEILNELQRVLRQEHSL